MTSPGTLADLHGRGVRIIGTEADAPLTTRQSDLRGPIAIVIGSEGHGLAPAVRRRCDVMVRIPMRGSIGSLNAAVAGSVLLFEALGQRDPDARPPAARDRGTPGRERGDRSRAGPVPRRAPVAVADGPAEVDTNASRPARDAEGRCRGPASADGSAATRDRA